MRQILSIAPGYRHMMDAFNAAGNAAGRMGARNSIVIPSVTEKTKDGIFGTDIFSRMLKDRTIFLNGPIDDVTAMLVTAQLQFLEAENPDADISMQINSPGGEIYSMFNIYDVMNFIKPDVSTFCVGLAASAASFLLMAGAPGKRFAMPNARIMIHQPLGGAHGQATDIQIEAKEIQYLKEDLTRKYAQHTGVAYEKLQEVMERDKYLSPKEAHADWNLIDRVVRNRADLMPRGPA